VDDSLWEYLYTRNTDYWVEDTLWEYLYTRNTDYCVDDTLWEYLYTNRGIDPAIVSKRCGPDCMVIGFRTDCAVTAYHY
jgi:hypothetical protein